MPFGRMGRTIFRIGLFLMIFPLTINRHGPKTLLVVLSILMLSVLDAFFTIELTSRGATELNPIMAYYLKQGDLIFFITKYLLTSAALLIILSLKHLSLFGNRIPRKAMLVFFLIAMGTVVQWELYLFISMSFP